MIELKNGTHFQNKKAYSNFQKNINVIFCGASSTKQSPKNAKQTIMKMKKQKHFFSPISCEKIHTT